MTLKKDPWNVETIRLDAEQSASLISGLLQKTKQPGRPEIEMCAWA